MRFFRPRRRAGCSALLLVAGLLQCLATAALLTFGVPASWQRARAVKALPRPGTALAELGAGTRAIFTVQVPPDRTRQSNVHGLALFYVETRSLDSTPEREPEDEATPSLSSQPWEQTQPPPSPVTLRLTNGEPVTVRLSQSVSFLNAEEIEAGVASVSRQQKGLPPRERRYVGYLPGQTLAVEGTWEGNQTIIARTCYAGSPDDYVAYVAAQPGQMALSGLFCGVMAVLLMGAGVVLRVLGR